MIQPLKTHLGLTVLLLCTSSAWGWGWDPVGDVKKAAENVGKAVEKAAQDTGKTVEKAAQDTGKTLEKAAQDTGKTVEKAAQDTGKTVEKAAQDTGNTIEKAAQDTGKTIEKAGQDTGAEIGRAGKNLEEAAQAIGKYIERTAQGTGRTLSSAEKRVREGKVVDAIWHLSTDQLKETEANAAKATQESSLIRTVGQVAASAYGGPGGAAAYASWYTFRETGDADLALRVGIITGATSAAFSAAGKMPSETANELARKAAVTGAIGGLAVAASGGDQAAIREGFLLAGGMVLVQDGYRRVAGSELDARSSQGEAYCMSSVGEDCSPPGSSYIRDKDGNIQYDSSGKPLVDIRKTDPRRPHVGNWSTKSEANWNHERGKFMTSVSRIPGMNAMSVFHDQWAVSWDMNTLTSVGTIAPAVVLTYTGTGTQYFELLRRTSTDKKQASGKTPAPIVPVDSSVPEERNQMRVLTSDAAKTSYVCSQGKISRTIVVEVPPQKVDFACRVIYLTDRTQSVPWSAKNDASYCASKAREFISKQMKWGWACFSR